MCTCVRQSKDAFLNVNVDKSKLSMSMWTRVNRGALLCFEDSLDLSRTAIYRF